MRTLFKDTAAWVVRSKDKPEGSVITLPEGTRYRTLGHNYEKPGYTITRIGVRRERYDIIG